MFYSFTFSVCVQVRVIVVVYMQTNSLESYWWVFRSELLLGVYICRPCSALQKEIVTYPVHALLLFLFSMCASVAAHYNLSQVCDKLVISLCKFTTLLNPPEV